MAEREGFEPSVEFPLHTLSKRAPSTTRTSLRSSGSAVYRTGETCSRRRSLATVAGTSPRINKQASAPAAPRHTPHTTPATRRADQRSRRCGRELTTPSIQSYKPLVILKPSRSAALRQVIPAFRFFLEWLP